MLIFILVLLSTTAQDIHRCQLSVGDIATCDATGFTGTASVEVSPNHVLICNISIGSVIHCGLPHTGPTVLYREGRYRSCSIISGFVAKCSATGFTGEAVIDRR